MSKIFPKSVLGIIQHAYSYYFCERSWPLWNGDVCMQSIKTTGIILSDHCVEKLMLILYLCNIMRRVKVWSCGVSKQENHFSMHEIYLAFTILGHNSLCQIMQARLQNLSLVSRLWTEGDIKVTFFYQN